jgi:hypothetical protein
MTAGEPPTAGAVAPPPPPPPPDWNTASAPATPPSAPAFGPGTPQPPAASAPFSSSKESKLPFIIVGIAVLLLVVVGAFLALGKKGNNPISKAVNSVTGGSGEVVSRSDGTLDLSHLIDKQETIKNQDLKAKLNQQVNLSDGTSYMVTKVERNFTPHSDFLKADTGKEFIKINVVVGNRTKDDSLYVTSSMFQVQNSAGGLQDPVFVLQDDVSDALKSGDVASGKQISGSLIFQVDKDEKISALVTEDKYQSFTSDQKVTIKSTVALQ